MNHFNKKYKKETAFVIGFLEGLHLEKELKQD
jgi:hypothetical protein